MPEPGCVADLPRLVGALATVVFVVLDACAGAAGECCLAHSEIAAQACISVSSVRRAVGLLADAGVVDVEHGRHTSAYRVRRFGNDQAWMEAAGAQASGVLTERVSDRSGMSLVHTGQVTGGGDVSVVLTERVTSEDGGSVVHTERVTGDSGVTLVHTEQVTAKNGPLPSPQTPLLTPLLSPLEPMELVMEMEGCGIQAKRSGKRVREIASEQPSGFAEVWAAYPRKVSKQRALEAWAKLRPAPGRELVEVMLRSIEGNIRAGVWDGTVAERSKFIPHMATWLHGAMWEDEIPAVQAAAAPMRRARRTDDDKWS